jgi:hypothetical protein
MPLQATKALSNEEIYDVWVNCHQTMLGIHDRDEAEAVGDPENRGRNIPEYFSDEQRDLAEYILIRESMRAVGRC